MVMTYGCLTILRAIFMGACPFSGRLGVQEIREGCKNFPKAFIVFICTKLMMMLWGRLLIKIADLVVYIPPGETFWPYSMQKSFVLGFGFTFIPHRPWRIWGTPKFLKMIITVSLMI